jgi:hypothetical protein
MLFFSSIFPFSVANIQKKNYFCKKIAKNMAKNSKWQDDYWLLLMQFYLQKPVGMKPMYSRKMVDLSMELHIAPDILFNKMCQIANLETPRIEHIWETYGNNPRKLSRAVSLLREMRGFNNAEEFYDGVETNESFEKDFRPIADDEMLTPVMLILILDEYFRLTPITMVAETPEVQQLARLLKLKPQKVVEVLEVFQHCDPYLNRKDVVISPLLLPCQLVWRRFGNAKTEDLASYAAQLKEYFR